MHTFILILGAFAILGMIAAAIISAFRHEFIVPEGYVGLLYHKGRFVATMGPGGHVVWGRKFTISAQDTRKTSLLIPAQDVLTADNVSLKLSLLVSYQVHDPVKAEHDCQHWHTALYNAAQVALRAAVNGATVEALLTQRLDIAAQFVSRVQPEASQIGITIHTIEVKDVMFPADLKRAFADVLKAKQEGQAALERARGESAALRNLANAARMLEGNPALMNLRLMQSLATAQNAGSTFVLGMPQGFVPLKNGHGASSDSAADKAS